MNDPPKTSLPGARKRWSDRYLTALRGHLRPERSRNRSAARLLGHSALAGGLAQLDVAVLHEKAVLALAEDHDFSDPKGENLKRAGFFFTQVLGPFEAAQLATRKANRLLHQKNEVLRRHTEALAHGNRRLEREIARRKAAEIQIREGTQQYQTLFLESVLMQKKLRRLTHQIISAQEEERKEISRELHDEVVQKLVGINVELSALNVGTSLGLRNLKSKILRAQRLVENSVTAVHRFARELRPAMLDDLGLIPALHAYSKNLASRKRIKIQITAFSRVEELSNAKRTVLYRVAQEALTNVVRHAEAARVVVNLIKAPGAVKMEIIDNGKSFAVDKTLQTKTNHRLGLVGMRERVEMVGGTLTIESAVGRGTTIRALIPIDGAKV
jgi:signal transduction histidine kinase